MVTAERGLARSAAMGRFFTRRSASEQPPAPASRWHHARPPLPPSAPARPSPCPPPRGGAGRWSAGGGGLDVSGPCHNIREGTHAPPMSARLAADAHARQAAGTWHNAKHVPDGSAPGSRALPSVQTSCGDTAPRQKFVHVTISRRHARAPMNTRLAADAHARQAAGAWHNVKRVPGGSAPGSRALPSVQASCAQSPRFSRAWSELATDALPRAKQESTS